MQQQIRHLFRLLKKYFQKPIIFLSWCALLPAETKQTQARETVCSDCTWEDWKKNWEPVCSWKKRLGLRLAAWQSSARMAGKASWGSVCYFLHMFLRSSCPTRSLCLISLKYWINESAYELFDIVLNSIGICTSSTPKTPNHIMFAFWCPCNVEA